MKIVSIRTEHPVPTIVRDGSAPISTHVSAADVGPMEATTYGVVYTVDARRVLIPWLSVRHAELEPVAAAEPAPTGAEAKPSTKKKAKPTTEP